MKIDTHHVPESAHGWKDVWAPSAIPFNELYPTPIEMSLEQIEELKRGFVASTKLSKQAGYDVIEIHNAHGSVGLRRIALTCQLPAAQLPEPGLEQADGQVRRLAGERAYRSHVLAADLAAHASVARGRRARPRRVRRPAVLPHLSLGLGSGGREGARADCGKC